LNKTTQAIISNYNHFRQGNRQKFPVTTPCDNTTLVIISSNDTFGPEYHSKPFAQDNIDDNIQ
jgi:hypothetical protein